MTRLAVWNIGTSPTFKGSSDPFDAIFPSSDHRDEEFGIEDGQAVERERSNQ